MSDRRATSAVLPVAVTLTVLLGLYVGAYFWSVEPVNKHGFDTNEPPQVPSYSIGNQSNWLRRFFSPIHWLDRRIRPHVWEPTP